MRYKKDHKKVSRDCILSSALKLFSHQGFNNVSIDEIMTDAGLTRGAFYAHFESKQQLYAEAIISAGLNDRTTISKAANGKTQLKLLVSDYLEADYSDPDELPCPLAYLVTDVAIREPEVRSAYAESYESLNSRVKYLMSIDGDSINEEVVPALTSMMIGSVAIARTLTDSAATQLLHACKKSAYKLIDNA